MALSEDTVMTMPVAPTGAGYGGGFGGFGNDGWWVILLLLAMNGGWGFGGDNAIPIECCALALFGAKTSKRDPTKKGRIG
jgi:hypothetical protein